MFRNLEGRQDITQVKEIVPVDEVKHSRCIPLVHSSLYMGAFFSPHIYSLPQANLSLSSSFRFSSHQSPWSPHALNMKVTKRTVGIHSFMFGYYWKPTLVLVLWIQRGVPFLPAWRLCPPSHQQWDLSFFFQFVFVVVPVDRTIPTRPLNHPTSRSKDRNGNMPGPSVYPNQVLAQVR